MNNKWFWVRLVVLLAIVGGLGYLGYRYFIVSTIDQLYDKGARAYEEGVKALDEKNWSVAMTRFDEATLISKKGLDELGEALKNKPEADDAFVNSHKTREAKFLWLKARAMRDHFYAKTGSENVALPIATDSITGEGFREVLAIKDAQLRDEALKAQQNAAMTLKEPRELFVAALRSERFLPKPNWHLIKDMSDKILAADDKDVTCHFLMARYEFEQPSLSDREFAVTPENKRSPSKVLAARKHLEKLQESKDCPLWRTLHLQAKVTSWLVAHYAENGKDEHRAAEEQALRKLLEAVPARAKSGDGFTRLGEPDVEGVLDLHLMGLKLLINDQRKEGDVDGKRLLESVDRVLDFCETANAKDKIFPVDKLAITGLEALKLTQPYLARVREADWQERLGRGKELAKAALAARPGSMGVVGSFSDLLSREARVEDTRGNPAIAKKLRSEIDALIEGAIKTGLERKVPLEEAVELNYRAATTKLINGGKRADIQPHLDVLVLSKDPKATLAVALIEGTLDAQDGRLTKARQRLEKVLTSGDANMMFQAQLSIVSVYLALGQPKEALANLRELERIYQSLDELTEQDRAWAFEFLRSPQEQAYLQLVANLETAKQNVADFLRKHPGKLIPASLMEGNEREALRLMKSLPLPPQALNLRARVALVRYFMALERDKEAGDQLAQLKKDFPESAQTLQLEVGQAIRDFRVKQKPSKSDKKDELDPKLVAQVDTLIQNFMKAHPESRSAKLYWSTWLVQSKRADKAVAYLEDPLNFPGAVDDAHRRILALALLGKGQVEEARKILQHLEKDPNVAALLVHVASTVDEQRKELSEAITRFESAGLFRCWNASLAMQEGKLEEACKEYFTALDYSRVTPLARTGLQGALFALARTDPGKARALVLEFLKTQPSEHNLYLAYAFASVMLDDIGAGGDTWERAKNMAAALGKWEAMADKESHTTILLTKAEFWSLAGQDDVARGLISAANGHDPKDARAVRMLLALALANPTAENLAAAAKHADKLAELEPASADPGIYRAFLAERTGKTPEALVLLENMLGKHAKEGRVYRGMVRLLQKEKQPAQARDWAQKWLKEMPDDIEAAVVWVSLLAEDKKTDEARDFAKTYIKKQMQDTRDRLAKAKKPADDKELAKQRKALEDLEHNYWIELTAGLMRAKAYEEAELWVDTVLKDQPDNLAALVLVGEIMVAKERWTQARAHYEQILKKHPGTFVVGNNLAWLLAAKLDQPEHALTLARGLRLGQFSKKPLPGNRMNVSFVDTLGTIYTKLDRKDLFPEMRDLFEQAIRRYPADPRMFLFLGHAYRGLNETAKAEAMYATAIALARRPYPTLDARQNADVLREAEDAQKRLAERGGA